MKLRAVWTLCVFAAALSADPTAVVTCTPGAASVPVFSTSSVSGAVGDYTLDCTGGIPAPAPPIPQEIVTISTNVPILDTGGWILSDGVNMTSGTLQPGDEVIEFLGVPFDPPGAGNLDLTVENIFVNPSLETPGFQFTASGAMFGDTSVEIDNPLEVVAQNAVPEPLTLPFVSLGVAVVCLARKRVRVG